MEISELVDGRGAQDHGDPWVIIMVYAIGCRVNQLIENAEFVAWIGNYVVDHTFYCNMSYGGVMYVASDTTFFGVMSIVNLDDSVSFLCDTLECWYFHCLRSYYLVANMTKNITQNPISVWTWVQQGANSKRWQARAGY